MKNRKIACIILGALLFQTNIAVASGLLPSLDDIYGVEIPSFSDVIKKAPNSIETTEEGLIYCYNDVSDRDYYAYGDLLNESGCQVEKYEVDQGRIKVYISKKGKVFNFTYITESNTLFVLYPEGVNDFSESEQDYQKAVGLMKSGEFEQAISLFEKLNGYEDSAELITACRNEKNYQQAQSFYNSGEYEKAYDLFNTIVDYKDVADILANDDRFAKYIPKAWTDQIEVGDYILYGNYEQDNSFENGKEPIIWIVLEKKKNQVLLLSKYCLDAIPYDTNPRDTTWEMCSLRLWLNRDFFSLAFTSEEQARIVESNIDNSKSQGIVRDAGKNTKDHVFLLSYKESQQYMTDYIRVAAPTSYAIERKAYQSDGKTVWWLRSRGGYNRAECCIGAYGGDTAYDVGDNKVCIRPALWLNIGKR